MINVVRYLQKEQNIFVNCRGPRIKINNKRFYNNRVCCRSPANYGLIISAITKRKLTKDYKMRKNETENYVVIMKRQ